MDKLASLGIDPWSMVLYLVNTGLLLAVLTYVLYKPILKFIDQRRSQIENSIKEAANLQESFEQKLKDLTAEKEEAEAQLRTELEQMRSFVEKKRTELLAEMETARADMMAKAQSEIDAKKAALLKEAENDVKGLMMKIVLEIVENKVPEDVIQDSIKSAWKQYS